MSPSVLRSSIFAAALLLPNPAIVAVGQTLPMTSQKPVPLDPFEQSVRDYLLKNPEVLLEAMQILQERQQVAAAEQQQGVIDSHRQAIFNDPRDPIAGNPAGDVTLVEFFDYNCPYCRKAASVVVELEKADPDLRLVFKEFPILGAGSTFAARAALAAKEQGKHVALHHALMQAEDRVTEDLVMTIAAGLGLDTERLRRDMQSPEVTALIDDNQRLAAALGITGTPSFVIGDRIIPGVVGREELQRLVSSARQSKDQSDDRGSR
jgi:protein-disulfide isomerase